MKPSTVLKKARALLIEKGWCKGDYAQDKDGNPVPQINKTKETT